VRINCCPRKCQFQDPYQIDWRGCQAKLRQQQILAKHTHLFCHNQIHFKMGFLDVVFPNTKDIADLVGGVSGPDPGEGVALGSAIVAGGSGIASGGTLAGLLLPTLASIYLEGTTERVLESTHQSLSELSENLDGDDMKSAGLAKACDGVCRLIDPALPDHDLVALAHNEPEQLDAIFDKVLAADDAERNQLEQIERSLSAVLLGEDPPKDVDLGFDPSDYESLVEELQDIFETENDQEAIHLFILYEEFLADLTTEFTSNLETKDHAELDDAVVEDLCAIVEQLNEHSTKLIEEWLRIELADEEGFTQLDVDYFHGRTAFKQRDPLTSWIFGDITHGQIHESRQSDSIRYQFDLFAPESELPFRQDIQNQLATSEKPTAVVAGPECGKSTLCRQVAYDWVNDNQGIVFYRSTDSKLPFTASTKLIAAIERAQDRGSGHPLIVVEDAARDDATEIFDVISEIQDERPDLDVSFLLDSRQKEWERFVEDEQNPYKQLVNPLRNESTVDRIDLPQLSVRTCEDAISVLSGILELTNNPLIGRPNRGGWMDRTDPQTLYEQVVTELPDEDPQPYQITTLVTELFTHVPQVDISPLKSSGAETHQKLVPERGSETTFNRELQYRLSVLLNILNASENSVHPELLFAVGLPEIEEISKNEVRPVFTKIERLLLDPDNDLQDKMYRLPSGGPIRTDSIPCRPTAWSESFLENGYKNDRHRTVMRKSIIDAFDGIFELYENRESRQLIQQWFKTESRFEAESYFSGETDIKKAESLLKSVFEWAGGSNMSLDAEVERRQLFKSTTDGLFEPEPVVDKLPEDFSPLLKYVLQFYVVPTSQENAEPELKKLEHTTHTDDNLTTKQQLKLFGDIHFLRAICLDRYVDAYPVLDKRKAKKQYRLAIECSEITEEYDDVANILDLLRKLEPPGNQPDILEYMLECYNNAENRKESAKTISELADSLEETNYERAQELHNQAFLIYKNLGDYTSAARSLRTISDNYIDARKRNEIDIMAATSYLEASIAMEFSELTVYEIGDELSSFANSLLGVARNGSLESQQTISHCLSVARAYFIKSNQQFRRVEKSDKLTPPDTPHNSKPPVVHMANNHSELGFSYVFAPNENIDVAKTHIDMAVDLASDDSVPIDQECDLLSSIGYKIMDYDGIADREGLDLVHNAIMKRKKAGQIEKAADSLAFLDSYYDVSSDNKYRKQAFEILKQGPDSTSVAYKIFTICIPFDENHTLSPDTVRSWYDEALRKVDVAEVAASTKSDKLSVSDMKMTILYQYAVFNLENDGHESENAERQLKNVIDIYQDCRQFISSEYIASYGDNPAGAASKLAEIYNKRNNIPKSIQWNLASVSLTGPQTLIHNSRLPMSNYQNMANIYQKDSEKYADKIRRCYDIAISIGERHGSRYNIELAELWKELAEFERSVSEDHNQAIVSAYKNAIDYYEAEAGEKNLVNVASLYEDLASHHASVNTDLENAANCSRHAMAAYADATRFGSLTDPWYEFVGHMKASDASQYQTAHSLLLDGLGHCREEKDHKQRITFRLWLGLTCKISDEYTVDEAVSHIKKGLEICDESDQTHSYLTARLYEELSQTWADSEAPGQALEFCENSLEICIDYLSSDTEPQTQTDDFLNIVFENLQTMSDLDAEHTNSIDYESYYDDLRKLLEDNEEVLKKEENCSLARFEQLSTTISLINH